MSQGIRIANPLPGHSKFTSQANAEKFVRKNRAKFLPDGSLQLNHSRMPRTKEKPELLRQYGNTQHGQSYGSGSEKRGPTSEELQWRESVLARDGYACVFCGSTKNLEADHIKPKALYPDLKYDVGNGRTLCNPCHRQTPTYGGKVRHLAGVEVF